MRTIKIKPADAQGDKKKTYIYRVTFPEAYRGSEHHFFGSLAAIYEVFTPSEIGCKVSRLWNVKITPESPYIGRSCTISKELVRRKKKNN